MADRTIYYLSQLVSAENLNTSNDQLEQAIHNIVMDTEMLGILQGLEASERAIPSMQIEVAEGVARDFEGRRLSAPVVSLVNLTTDTAGVATAVGVGKERWISVFAQYKTLETGPFQDPLGATGYTDIQEISPIFIKIMGAEADEDDAVRPALSPPDVLICDVLRTNGQTTILNAAIDITRRQDCFVAGDAPVDLRAGTFPDAIAAMVGLLQDHVDGGAGTHPGTAISIDASVAWADTTPNASGTAQSRIDKILQDLAPATGAIKIGAAGTVNWKDATNISNGTVQGHIDGMITALASNSGTAKIGGAAQTSGATSITAVGLATQLGQLLALIDTLYAMWLGRPLSIPASMGIGTLADFNFNDNQQYWGATAAGGIVILPVPLCIGDRITQVEIFLENTVTTAQTASLVRKAMTSTTVATIASDSTAATTGDKTITLSGLSETLSGNNQWHIRCVMAATGNRVRGARVTYSRP
jgi:hypothetical protein